MDHQFRPSGSHVQPSLQASQINPLPHPFTFESHSYSQADFIDHPDHDTDHTQCRTQIQKEYKLKTESLTKQYEVKLARERETFELKEHNYEEEIQNLKKQISEMMFQKVQRKQETLPYCSLCSNGEVLNYMKNMLQSVEESHRDCLSQKQQLNLQISNLDQKLSVLEEENALTEEKYQKCRQEVRQLRQEKESFEREKRERERQYREKERACQVREIQLQQEISKTKVLEKELQKEIKATKADKEKQTIDHDYVSNNFNREEKENPYYRTIPERQHEESFDSITHQLSRNASYLQPLPQNKEHMQWNPKVHESYAEYAGMRRKSKRVKDSFYEGTVDFETFRPSGKYGYMD